MSDHFLNDRRAGLENAFFAKQDALLRQRLGEAEEIKTQRETLSAASGIKDVAVLNKLLTQKITAATLAALSLVPLVVVAWADGSLDAKERNAILASAEQAGLNKQQASYQMFERWLATMPPPTLLATWQSYVTALSATLSDEALLALKTEILGRARAVAEAAGGFMGLGQKVSTEEAAMLGVLDRAFAAAG